MKDMKDIKEYIKIGVLLFLVVFFTIFFIVTKGEDDFSIGPMTVDSSPSYEIVASEYNGQYKNNKDNGMYALIGKNSDGTYRVALVEKNGMWTTYPYQATNTKMESNVIKATVSNANLRLVFDTNNGFTIPKEIGYGNAQLEGYYQKVKSISRFDLDDVEEFK